MGIRNEKNSNEILKENLPLHRPRPFCFVQSVYYLIVSAASLNNMAI